MTRRDDVDLRALVACAETLRRVEGRLMDSGDSKHDAVEAVPEIAGVGNVALAG